MYNILIWRTLVSQNLDFIAIDRSESFSVLPLSFISALLLSPPFAFHILSGCCKTMGVNYGQSMEMGP